MALTDVPIIGNLMRALGELIPGEQPFLGEIPGGAEGLLGGPWAALMALVPGAQLGEARRPPVEYVKTWSTGTVTMFLLTDGKIGCFKKNGLWKTWRPAKHIVVPRNPRIGTLLAAHKRTTRLVTGLAKQAGYSKRRALGRLQQQYLSPVERLQLTGGRN